MPGLRRCFKESRGKNVKSDTDGGQKAHLSQSGSHRDFAAYVGILIIALFLTMFHILWANYHQNKDMEKTISLIAAYMASATKDEYDDIAKTIRHDLVCSEFGEDIENFIQYIPNTADYCRTCMDNYSAQVFLICTNTGESYPLDLFRNGEEPDAHYGGAELSFGYDEISQTHLHITKSPGQKEGYAELYRKNGIVSMHRMKNLFCDNCIQAILNIVSKQAIGEFVIFNPQEKVFYPIEAGTVTQIGDYTLETKSEKEGYKITIRYVGN